MKSIPWKYKNIIFVFVSIIFALFISRIETFHSFLIHLGAFGYLGAFFAGVIFVSVFTVSTGCLILLILAESLHPVEIGLIAGLGAVAGDLLIFRFVKDGLSGEIEGIYNHFDKKHHWEKLFHTKYFSWTLPLIGAMIIASPLPDEFGVSLMGISKMKTVQFMAISFLLNSIGIFLIVSASILIKS